VDVKGPKTLRQFCEDCRYFWKADPHGEMGVCRRYPPTVCAIFDSGDERTHEITIYPTLNVKEWCGEWRLPNQ
jgi:hypothetical protein